MSKDFEWRRHRTDPGFDLYWGGHLVAALARGPSGWRYTVNRNEKAARGYRVLDGCNEGYESAAEAQEACMEFLGRNMKVLKQKRWEGVRC